MLMVFTDTVMMGKLGPESLAGGGLGAASYNFVSFFCVGRGQRSHGQRIFDHSAVGAARPAELHGPARLHERAGPGHASHGDQPGGCGAELRSELRVYPWAVRLAALGPDGHRTGDGHPFAQLPERTLASGPAHRRHLCCGGWPVHICGVLHGRDGQHADGSAPDCPAVGVDGIHGACRDFLRGDHAHWLALRRRQPVTGAHRRAYGHWFWRSADAVVRHSVLGRASCGHRPVRGRQRSKVSRRGRAGGEAAGYCGVVRNPRRDADHRNGRDSWLQGRKNHFPDRPGQLLGGGRASGMGPWIPCESGRSGRVVGAGDRLALLSRCTDLGVRAQDHTAAAQGGNGRCGDGMSSP
nr:hypothetical protein [Tanacetum cinerariifolium]